MRNWFQKGIALVLSLAFSLSFMLVNLSAQASEKEAETTGKEPTYEKAGYFHYEAEHAGKPMGSQHLELKAEDAEAERAALSERDKIACWKTEAGGRITWEFDVKQAGRYQIAVTYMAGDEGSDDLRCSLLLDGKRPFEEAASCRLKRHYKNKHEVRQDKTGNDLIPGMKEVHVWRSAVLLDSTGYQAEGYLFWFEAGRHSLTLETPDNSILIAAAELRPSREPRPYAEMKKEWASQGLKPYDGKTLQFEAENPFGQSDTSLYPVYDRTGAATSPNDPAKIRRNTIGQMQWAENGMYITYKINAKQAGLYGLTLKFRQNYLLGTAVFRNIYVNGKIPCAECKNVRFTFDFSWQNRTLQDRKGNPVLIPLKKGENTLTFCVTLGPWDRVLQGVDVANGRMNDLYRRIIMVTSSNPDPYRDYFLTREIKGLEKMCQDLSDDLSALADEFDRINGGASNQSAPLKRASEQMHDFAVKPADIQDHLSSFREQIAMLSEWLLTNKQQPLELDYFLLHAPEAELPAPGGTFWQNFVFGVKQFFAAFSEDYNSMDDGGEDAVLVWVNDGRDQTQMLKDLIYDRFSSKQNIGVRINLVQGGLIEATLSGNGPDVAIGVARGQPVNLACRSALASLEKQPGFDRVKNRFSEDALLPYTYNDHVYALPMTQTYLVMFYRTDILRELELEVPQTWDEMLSTAAVLQRKNMAIGLPYTAITAAGAVDLGVGAKDLFPTLLLQNGGSYYNRDLTKTDLDSQIALDAFNLWTAFYTRYGFDLSYDFNTRFRTGEMPIAIAAYTMYGMLSAAAPEIRGQWEMTAMPGVKKPDGSIDRSGGASGSAVVMFENAANKEACWKLMDFITSDEIQGEYGNEIEALLGPAARYATANLNAFEKLPWTGAEKDVLLQQRKWVREIPEIPGSYYTSRCIDNAFRDVVYNRKTPRTALERENDAINRELKRKREELTNW